jgi:PST family polysaccharide transporter
MLAKDDGTVTIRELAIAPPISRIRSEAQRLRRSTLFTSFLSVGLATIASRALGLVALGYPARTLGPEYYGMAGYAASLVAYAAILQSPGLVLWGTRAIARDESKAGETLFSVTIIRVALGLVGFAVLAVFAFLSAHSPVQRSIILVTGTVLVFSALTPDWALNGLGAVRIPAWIGVGTTALIVGGLFALVHSPADVLAYCGLKPAMALVGAVAGGFVLVRVYKVRRQPVGLAQLWRVLIDSAPLGIFAALVVVLHYSNNLIIYARLGSYDLGVFLASYRLIELATMIPGLLGTVFFPRLMKTAVNDVAAARSGARLFAKVHMVAAFFVSAVLLAESPAIIHLIYGAKYQAAVPLLRIMALSVVFNYAICGYTNCLISFGRDRVMIAVVSVSAVVSVGGGLLLVPLLGLWGAAVVIASIDLAGWLVSLRAYKESIGSLNFDLWLWPAAGGLLVSCLSVALQQFGVSVWIRAALIVLAYAPFAVLKRRGRLAE